MYIMCCYDDVKIFKGCVIDIGFKYYVKYKYV